MNDLSGNTQAILLLTAPLIAGRKALEAPLLTPGEYRKLAARLHGMNAEPADLLGGDAFALIDECGDTIEPNRLKSLVDRGFLLSQAVDRWSMRAIWILSRADEAYPQQLKQRLGNDAPALLYGCGERSILDSQGLAMVGSRHVDESLLEYTREIASNMANAGRSVVSGAAKGVDQAAMNAALDAGGKVTGVLAGSLERTTMRREHRDLLLAGRLVLVSPYDPCAGFNVGHAMQRNKTIYALADAALVINATTDKGGTWAGAVEQLRKYATPVYVRSTGAASAGLEALRTKGALPWPNPNCASGIDAFFDGAVGVEPGSPVQPDLFDESPAA